MEVYTLIQNMQMAASVLKSCILSLGQVQAGLPEGCKWVEVYGKRLVQHNDKNLNSQKLTVAQCKKKCEDFGGFKCRSFDAHADTKKCQLSKADRAVSYLWDYMDGTWTYQEIQCDNGKWW